MTSKTANGYLATICGVLMVLAATSGCCSVRPGAIDDKIEAGCIIGYYSVPRRCVRPWRLYPRSAVPNSDVPVWVRVVSKHSPGRPVASRDVKLSVIYPTGGEIPPDIDVHVTPAVVSTGPDGFATGIVFRSAVPGSFLIRAEYPDGRALAVSYSREINVFRERKGSHCHD